MKQPYHKEFLKKREDLRKLSEEIPLVFRGSEAALYSEFVGCYELTLFKMYQYQIAIDKMRNENENHPMTQDELCKMFHEESYRKELYAAMEQLKAAYAAVIKEKVDSKIRNQLALR